MKYIFDSPKMPENRFKALQGNPANERFNRTLKEEFLDYHMHLFYDFK